MTKATQQQAPTTKAIFNIGSQIQKRIKATVPHKNGPRMLRAYEDLPDQEVPAPTIYAGDASPAPPRYKLSVLVLRKSDGGDAAAVARPKSLIVSRRNYAFNSASEPQMQTYWDVLRAFPAGDEQRIAQLLRPCAFDESLKVFVPKSHAYITLCETSLNKLCIE